MLDCFSIFLPCVRGDLQSVEELSYRFVCAQARENIAYTEVRYSPHLSFGILWGDCLWPASKRS